MKKSTLLAILVIAICITTGFLCGCQSQSSQLAALKEKTVLPTEAGIGVTMSALEVGAFKVVYDTYSGVFVDTLFADKCRFGKYNADFYVNGVIKTHYQFSGTFLIIAY